MANTYSLVNPHVSGTVDTKISADNSLQAAKKAYKNLAKHFNNNIPKFYFTLQKGSKGKFYHFEVKEKKEDEKVNFSIQSFQIKGNEKKAVSEFQKKLSNFKKKTETEGGGSKKKSKKGSKKKSKKGSKKSRKDSSSSEDSDSDISDSDDNYYKRAQKYVHTNDYSYPISYWWYDPYVYNLNSFYVPTFYAPLSPYIEIELQNWH
jgi:hypothetical protein